MKLVSVWLVTCVLWSTVFLFIKLGLHDLPPVSFAAMRLLIATAVLLPVILFRRVTLPRTGRDALLVAATGLLLLGVNYALLYWGAQYIPSGLTAVLQAATPAFGLVFAHRFLGEPFTALKLLALGVGIAGVAVLSLDQLHLAGWAGLLGCLAVSAGAVCVALAYVLVKAYGGHLHPTSLIAGQMLIALVPLLALGLITEGNPLSFRWTARAVLSLLYLSLAGSVVAFWLNYWLLRRMEASKLLMMSIVEPLLAVLLGAAVLGEAVTGRMLAGGALVLFGVWLALRPRPISGPEVLAREGDGCG